MVAKIKTNHEKLMAILKDSQDEKEAKKMACLGKAETTIKAGQEWIKAKIKTGLEERNTTVLKANQGKSEAIMEPSKWALCIEATYMLAIPQYQTSNAPRGAPKGPT